MLSNQKSAIRYIIIGAAVIILGFVLFSIGLNGQNATYERPPGVTPTPLITPEPTPEPEPTVAPTIEPTQTPLTTPRVYTGVVNDSSNVRSEPSTGADTVGGLETGTTVTIHRLVNGLDTSNDYDWYEITYDDTENKLAYIASQLVNCDDLLEVEEYTTTDN